MFHRRLHGPCPLLWRVVARGPEVEPSICDLAHNGAALAYLPDYTDRKEFWTLDGNLVRWVGVALLDVDGALRIWPVFVLGRRFSGLVAFSRGIRLLVPPLLARIHSLLREHFGRRWSSRVYLPLRNTQTKNRSTTNPVSTIVPADRASAVLMQTLSAITSQTFRPSQ